MTTTTAAQHVHSKDMPSLPSNIIGTFVRNQFLTTIPLPTKQMYPDVAGQTAIITGSNTGLGFEAARHLIALGLSHLVMGVRSLEKGQAAADKLVTFSTNPQIKIDVWHLDMEDYDSIQAFAKKCSELPRIDMAILNSGTAPLKFSTSPKTGHEVTVQVNHVSTSLLAILLLPVLAGKAPRGQPGKLTVVNSLTAHMCDFPMQDQRPLLQAFDKEENFVGDRYGMSKMLNQLFLARLAGKVDGSKVTINMVDPGLTKGTGLFQGLTGWFVVLLAKILLGIVGRPVNRGAATYVDAVLAKGAESHGDWLMNCRTSPYCHWYHDDKNGSRYANAIWEETMKKLHFAGVDEIVQSMQ